MLRHKTFRYGRMWPPQTKSPDDPHHHGCNTKGISLRALSLNPSLKLSSCACFSFSVTDQAGHPCSGWEETVPNRIVVSRKKTMYLVGEREYPEYARIGVSTYYLYLRSEETRFGRKIRMTTKVTAHGVQPEPPRRLGSVDHS